ncbi:Open rectifier potassium channel protein 1 [Anthophora retusa]
MSKKQWMVLLMLFLTYLLLGASIFYHIESQLEMKRIEEAKRERIEINALLHTHYVPSISHDHDEILGKLTRYCGKSVYNYTEGETDPVKWDFYNSFYFAYTVVSTIGYGNLAPTNMLSRILMILYGLVGIPMNGILLTQLGEFFGHVFVKAHQKYKSYKHGRNDYYPRKLTTFETGKVGLAAQIFIHLMPGFVMFIFFPAFLFSHYEGWSYDEAVYYAFVTLTTIGFGDYVAGQDNSKGNGVFFMLYKTFLICWISFGLGYTVMIMTFIARGMRSKKITRIEHKLAMNLKHTQSKIWNEFNKEINYLRRAFNELQLSKVKRVYVDECNCDLPPSKFPRSNSFPDLRNLLYGSKEKDSVQFYRPRRRANSEVVPTEQVHVTRVVSETDLQRIDKTATFATHAMVQPAELLARLVNILGYIPPATEDIEGGDGSNQTTLIGGARNRIIEENGDSKEEYFEKESTAYAACSGSASAAAAATWTIGQEKFPPRRFLRPRSRAASEIRLHDTRNEDRNIERTWSGPTAARKIQELMRARVMESSLSKERTVKETKFSKLRNFTFTKAVVPKALISSGPWKSRFSTSSLRKRSRRSSEFEQDVNGKNNDGRGPFVSGPTSTKSIDDRRDSNSTALNQRSQHYYTHTGGAANNLLEETSVADFLRALTVLHASVASADNDDNDDNAGSYNDNQHCRNQPRRKMGTASLTPPKLPSLFTLFSPSPPALASQSNQNTVTTHESKGNWYENKLPWPQTRRESSRRGSLAFVAPTAAKSRRFSLRPVATPISPPTPPTPSNNGSPFLPNSRRTPHETKSTFLFESPREPLIPTEGAPGLSSPIKQFSPLNGRRFSLRPAHQNQNVVSTMGAADNAAAVTTTLRVIPRWKAGMLQRQIGQMNLRRRVRAFSLSDVHAEDIKENIYEKSNRRDTICKNVFPRQGPNDEAKFSADSVQSSADRNFTTSTRLENRCLPLTHETVSSNFHRFEGRNLGISTDSRPQFHSGEGTPGSEQSLMEVKIENPATTTNIARNPFVKGETDNSTDLAELKIEKHQANSSTISKS